MILFGLYLHLESIAQAVSSNFVDTFDTIDDHDDLLLAESTFLLNEHRDE